MFSIIEQSVSITFSNTAYKSESVTPTAVTGYVPVGVIGYRFGSTGYSMVQLDVRSATLLAVAAEHINGQAVTGTVTVAVRLLYKKSS